jgi:hypothetical protein
MSVWFSLVLTASVKLLVVGEVEKGEAMTVLSHLKKRRTRAVLVNCAPKPDSPQTSIAKQWALTEPQPRVKSPNLEILGGHYCVS